MINITETSNCYNITDGRQGIELWLHFLLPSLYYYASDKYEKLTSTAKEYHTLEQCSGGSKTSKAASHIGKQGPFQT